MLLQLILTICELRDVPPLPPSTLSSALPRLSFQLFVCVRFGYTSVGLFPLSSLLPEVGQVGTSSSPPLDVRPLFLHSGCSILKRGQPVLCRCRWLRVRSRMRRAALAQRHALTCAPSLPFLFSLSFAACAFVGLIIYKLLFVPCSLFFVLLSNVRQLNGPLAAVEDTASSSPGNVCHSLLLTWLGFTFFPVFLYLSLSEYFSVAEAIRWAAGAALESVFDHVRFRLCSPPLLLRVSYAFQSPHPRRVARAQGPPAAGPGSGGFAPPRRWNLLVRFVWDLPADCGARRICSA
jgi:hypothetical protein